MGLPGKLGMTILPGVKDPGRWDRDLETDLLRLRRHHKTDALVTLLEPEEFERYGVPGFVERAREAGIEVIHFPIKDVDTPRGSQSDDYAALIERLLDLLGDSQTVVAHCRGGLGRTGTVAASVLVALGSDADEAIALVRKVRRSQDAVQTRGQQEYVRSFGEKWRARHEADPSRGRRARREPTRIERYRGCLLGLAVGDAVGTTVEFRRPGTFTPMKDMVGGGPFGLKAGEWTDDTSMALCLAESLIEKRGFDPADQLRKYVRWYREGHMSATGECFDIGGATREALERFERTGDPYSGSTDPGRAGNGSLMRLAPVPLFYAHAPHPAQHEAVERSGESSRTTHGARTAVDACRYMGALIMGAVNGAEKDELLSERYYPISGGWWDDNPLEPEVDEVSTGSFKRREPPEIRGRGYVVASLEAALWAFHNSDSFEEGCLLAVNLGEDADTTGAIYGQLAGAFYGERGIPEHWRRRLAHRLLIEHFAERLHHLGRTVDWEKLLEFLPIFERLGFVPGAGKDPSESSGVGAGQEMVRFMKTLYTAGAIYPFDWSKWHDEAGRFFHDPTLLESADEMTLRRLLTYHARVDYFNQGHLDEMIEAGHITRVLRVLRELKTG